MAETAYRLYVNNGPATREQLDQVEEITVEQTVDMAWEARLEIPICTDDQGRWSGEDDDFLATFSRLRVEVKVGGNFVPLIDGPVVGHDSRMSSKPGQSAITLMVQDDSVYLNRSESLESFDDLLDHEIATRIFDDTEEIAESDVEETPATGSGLAPVEVQRGTRIQILRRLAERQGKHAYVLPGPAPGESIGAFKALPSEAGDLPELILLGGRRNVASFNVTNDAQSPANVEAHSLSITDKAVTTARSSFRNLDLLGEEAAFEDEGETGTRLLQPGQDGAVDADQAVAAEATRASFAFEANGAVLSDCYGGVLRPYEAVTVRGVNGRLSGAYVIKQVTWRDRYSREWDGSRDGTKPRAPGGRSHRASARSLLRQIPRPGGGRGGPGRPGPDRRQRALGLRRSGLPLGAPLHAFRRRRLWLCHVAQGGRRGVDRVRGRRPLAADLDRLLVGQRRDPDR
jgi:hypothetical protein